MNAANDTIYNLQNYNTNHPPTEWYTPSEMETAKTAPFTATIHGLGKGSNSSILVIMEWKLPKKVPEGYKVYIPGDFTTTVNDYQFTLHTADWSVKTLRSLPSEKGCHGYTGAEVPIIEAAYTSEDYYLIPWYGVGESTYGWAYSIKTWSLQPDRQTVVSVLAPVNVPDNNYPHSITDVTSELRFYEWGAYIQSVEIDLTVYLVAGNET